MDLKTQPEDFVVKELKTIEKSEEGDYVYFLLKKKNWTTPEVVEEIAKALNIPSRQIGYAGNKDKKAITEQYLSFSKIKKEQAMALKIKDLELTYVTHAKERITLGDLEGNSFVIVVRDLEEEKQLEVKEIKNYFDDQRFGKDNNNHIIGKALVQHNFEEVCKLLQLEVDGNDFVKALRECNRKQLRFYLHSYQSHLWNQVVKHLKEPKETVPLLGYLVDLEREVKEQYEELMEKDGITQKSFLMQPMPELASEGAERKVFMEVKDFAATWGEDELNEGKKKVTLAFSLPSGAYATQVVKQTLAE